MNLTTLQDYSYRSFIVLIESAKLRGNIEDATLFFNRNAAWSVAQAPATEPEGLTGVVAGDFTSVTLTGTSYGTVSFTKVDADRWQTSYLGNGQEFSFFTSGANAGVLFAVPEPSSIVFAGIGVAMFGWSTWTRRRAKSRRRAVEASVA